MNTIARHYRGFYLRHSWTRKLLPAWRVYATLPLLSASAEDLIRRIREGE